jgi:hypothetical protein
VRTQKSNLSRNFHFLENRGEGQVKTLKETEQVRGTHSLSSAQGGTSKDTERNRVHKGHSLSVECQCTGRVKSEH